MSTTLTLFATLIALQVQGYHEFTESIRRAFSLPSDSELNITFTCDEPSSGEVSVGGEVEGHC